MRSGISSPQPLPAMRSSSKWRWSRQSCSAAWRRARWFLRGSRLPTLRTSETAGPRRPPGRWWRPWSGGLWTGGLWSAGLWTGGLGGEGAFDDGGAGQALGGQGGPKALELGGGGGADAGDAAGVFEDAEVAGEALGVDRGDQVGADDGHAVVADGHHRVARVLGQGGQPLAGLGGRGLQQDHHRPPRHQQVHTVRRPGRWGRVGRRGRAGRGVVRAAPVQHPALFGLAQGTQTRPAGRPGRGQHRMVPFPQGQRAPHHLLNTGMQVVAGRMIHIHHHLLRHHPETGRRAGRQIRPDGTVPGEGRAAHLTQPAPHPMLNLNRTAARPVEPLPPEAGRSPHRGDPGGDLPGCPPGLDQRSRQLGIAGREERPAGRSPISKHLLVGPPVLFCESRFGGRGPSQQPSARLGDRRQLQAAGAGEDIIRRWVAAEHSRAQQPNPVVTAVRLHGPDQKLEQNPGLVAEAFPWGRRAAEQDPGDRPESGRERRRGDNGTCGPDHRCRIIGWRVCEFASTPLLS